MKIHAFAPLTGLVMALALPAAAMAQTYEFSTCGAIGDEGPLQAACDTAYTATSLAGAVTVTGGIQSWVVPATGTYRITALGAAGRSATDGEYLGGRGARISGNFDLTLGDILQIAVGQEGSASLESDKLVGEAPTGNTGAEDPTGTGGGDERNGGGGGGTFVVDNSDNPLLIAGGGGGTRYAAGQDGCDANTGEYATTSSGGVSTGGCAVKADGLGVGGIALIYNDYGSAGAGFNGNGEADNVGEGGFSWANGMFGGHVYGNDPPADGGFGGGGTGEGSSGGGGGGGYSGGDAGWIAGGGGSLNNGANPAATAGIGTGDGAVLIQVVVPGAEARTTFAVSKEFSDGDNPTEVEVTINCFTGLPITQSQTIDETQDVTFVVTDFDSGELDCTITENELNGYTPTYEPDGPGTFDADGGCNFEDVEGDAVNACHIVNDADFVEVEIEKLWVIEGGNADQVDTQYVLTLFCDAPIEDGEENCGGPDYPVGQNGGYEACKEFFGDGTDSFFAQVQPEYPTSHCWVEETVFDSSVEIDNDCGNLIISAGNGDSCLITNTVFFEGIPTLGQYGMAILAVLMLGVGLVGFRRFA